MHVSASLYLNLLFRIRSHALEEGVLEAVLGRGALVGVEAEHGHQPVGEGLGHLGVPLVLLREDVEQGPGLEFCDVSQLA